MSLDIANVFNTLRWECVRGALRYHRVPAYIQEVIEDYFRDRQIEYSRAVREDDKEGGPSWGSAGVGIGTAPVEPRV